jgi:hypothetical protein
MKSKVRAANSWNFLISEIEFPEFSLGWIMAKIHSEIGLEEKTEMRMGQGELLHKMRARSHSKKIWERVSGGPLQKGQTQASTSAEDTKRPIFARVGRISQTIFHSKCLRRAWSLSPQRRSQEETEMGESRPPTEKERS